MNPLDEEEIKENDEEIVETEAIEAPVVIEEEHIVRHAEKNDSYREAPTLDNNEEIVQSPLDPSDEVEMKVDVPNEDNGQVKEDVLVMKEVIPDVVPVTTEEISPLPHMSQHDIEPEGVPHEEVTVEQKPSPEMMPQIVQEVVTEQVAKAPQASPQEVPVTPVEPVVYHTISGGPETLNNTISHHKNVDQVNSQPSTTYTNTTMGYTIPNPNYVPPVVPVTHPQSYFGIILFFGFILILSGALGYVYFVMPETFNQFFSAVVVIKDQILKK